MSNIHARLDITPTVKGELFLLARTPLVFDSPRHAQHLLFRVPSQALPFVICSAVLTAARHCLRTDNEEPDKGTKQ